MGWRGRDPDASRPLLPALFEIQNLGTTVADAVSTPELA
jgi:hypothetical protein